jgi:hypothetical protein
MKTDRDAIWSLAMLLAVPVLVVGVLMLLGAIAEEPVDTNGAVLIVAMIVLAFAPDGMWQGRNAVVSGGPRGVRRLTRTYLGMFGIIFVLQEPDPGVSLAEALMRWWVLPAIFAAQSSIITEVIGKRHPYGCDLAVVRACARCGHGTR